MWRSTLRATIRNRQTRSSWRARLTPDALPIRRASAPTNSVAWAPTLAEQRGLSCEDGDLMRKPGSPPAAALAPAAQAAANYDEAKVPPYTLPDPLLRANGERVAGAAAWTAQRPEILRLFETEIYGRSPGRPPSMTFEVTSVDAHALE